jgi:outer membrane protein OmpA-like peptidoglycan-associated protein
MRSVAAVLILLSPMVANAQDPSPTGAPRANEPPADTKAAKAPEAEKAPDAANVAKAPEAEKAPDAANAAKAPEASKDKKEEDAPLTEEERHKIAAKALGGSEVQFSLLTGLHVFDGKGALGRGFAPSAANRINTGVEFGARAAYLPIQRLAFELSAVTTPTSIAAGTSVGVHTVAVHALVNALTGRFRPFGFVGGGASLLTSSSPEVAESDVRPVVDAGGGLSFDIGSFWGVRADGRVRFLPGAESTIATDGLVGLALYSRFPPPPKPPPPVRVILDGDRDGLSDALDKCPTAAGPIRNDGCPEASDRDHDGVPDKTDACPDEAGSVELQGCVDADGDGLVGEQDKCPTVKGAKEDEGCAPKDTDGDGLIDRADKCPKEAETKNGFEDDDGCPDTAPPPPAPVQPPSISKAAERLDFETGSATITAGSAAFLDDLAGELKAAPGNLEIIGHTDSRGNEATNLALSKRRAEAVRQALLERGVAADRITATGKGSSEPIADNTTEEGRRTNRRVQFRVISAR